MRTFSSLTLLAALVLEDAIASPAQVPFTAELSSEHNALYSYYSTPLIRVKEPRKLHGRFLHITDMHPDPYYTPKSSQSTACHRKKPKKKKQESLYYGTPYSCVDTKYMLPRP